MNIFFGKKVKFNNDLIYVSMIFLENANQQCMSWFSGFECCSWVGFFAKRTNWQWKKTSLAGCVSQIMNKKVIIKFVKLATSLTLEPPPNMCQKVFLERNEFGNFLSYQMGNTEAGKCYFILIHTRILIVVKTFFLAYIENEFS